MSNLLFNFYKKMGFNFSSLHAPIWRAVGFSVLVHLFVFWFALQLVHSSFSISQTHNENLNHFSIDVKLMNGDSLSTPSSESTPESSQLSKLAETVQQSAQATSNTPNVTDSFKQPTQTTRPIGHYAASSWGRVHFVNTTELVLNKVSQLIGQISPVLTQTNFSGQCVIYIGPSDLLVSLHCNAKEEHVSQLLPMIQQNFRMAPDINEYWRCIEINNTEISLKEKCDAL